MSNFSVHVSEGEVLGVIGPNGSGKSTAINIISRLIAPDSGAISFNGDNLLSVKAIKAVQIGIARTFQTSVLSSALNVYENVAVGCYAVRRRDNAAIGEILQMVELTAKQTAYPTALSYFERRKVEFARALAAQPKLLLLDEPTAGFSQSERNWFEQLLEKVQKQGTATVIIEHDLAFIYRVADRIVVLDAGNKIAEGIPKDIANNKKVTEIYLGIAANNAANSKFIN